MHFTWKNSGDIPRHFRGLTACNSGKDTTFRQLDRLLSKDQCIFPLMGDHNSDSVFNIKTSLNLTFSPYPWRLAKIMFTPEDFHKMWAYRWRIWVLPMKSFVKIKASPPEIKASPPEQKKLIGKSSILARGKSCVLPTDPFFTCAIDYIPMYPSDR